MFISMQPICYCTMRLGTTEGGIIMYGVQMQPDFVVNWCIQYCAHEIFLKSLRCILSTINKMKKYLKNIEFLS